MYYCRTILEDIIDVNNVITIYYYEFAKDYVFKGESHDFWEFVYVDKGEIEVKANVDGYRLTQGEVIFHKPMEFHNLWANGKTAPNLVIVSFHCDSAAMKFFYDPANLVMVTGADPVKGVYTLKDYIVYTHAKDGIMIKKTKAEIIYNYFAEGGIEDITLSDYFEEVPLGKGEVDFKAYLNALKDIGYNGFLTIEREVGNNPERDIKEAVNYLKELI